ncbi:MAG: hypothetical protein JOY98_04215 [Candidatus Eremiobacteraeota bacterium]|nr:hypothetical protein [Candidatus Eremiobacteraeota bacterium]
MEAYRYTARIGSGSIAEDLSYAKLLERTLEFVLRAAVAKAIDEFAWEQEELRRSGLRAIEFVRDGKAIWWDAEAFELEQKEAWRERIAKRFSETNELDSGFFVRLDRDLRDKLRRAGYEVPSLVSNMRDLFREVGADATDRSAEARERLVGEILEV